MRLIFEVADGLLNQALECAEWLQTPRVQLSSGGVVLMITDHLAERDPKYAFRLFNMRIKHPELEQKPVDGIPLGYRLAGRITSGFDGGNHSLKSDVWACRRCGTFIQPGDDYIHDRHHAEIDSLLDESNQAAVHPEDRSPGG